MDLLHRTTTLYRTQFELLWRWRAGRRALLWRALMSLLASLIAFNVTAWLLPGQIHVVEFGGSLVAVLFLAILNLLLRPVLLGLVAGRSIVALILLTLVFQAVAIWLLDPFVAAVDFTGGFLSALIVSFVFGAFVGAFRARARARARTTRTTARSSARWPAAGRT